MSRMSDQHYRKITQKKRDESIAGMKSVMPVVDEKWATRLALARKKLKKAISDK